MLDEFPLQGSRTSAFLCRVQELDGVGLMDTIMLDAAGSRGRACRALDKTAASARRSDRTHIGQYGKMERLVLCASQPWGQVASPWQQE